MPEPSVSAFDRLLGVLMWPMELFERIPRPWQDRLVGLVLGVPGWTVLGLALYLNPSPAGVGTHQQLGLGGCAVLILTGYPCPMCGMTTTFSHLAHLHLIEGTLNQPFGLFLFVATVIAAVVGLLDFILPRGRWRRLARWVEERETALAVFLLVGMFTGWLYKILHLRGFLPWSP